MNIQLTPEEITTLTEAIRKTTHLADQSRTISEALGIMPHQRAILGRILTGINAQAEKQIRKSAIHTTP